MHFSANKLSAQESYQLLVGGVTPRPIAWISTQSAAGVDNLAPYSFFTVASCNPPVLMVTQVSPRDLKNKDTLTNLLETKVCVVNVVSAELIEQMNLTSALLPASESEFDFADVEKTQSQVVKAPSVKAAPVRYECQLREVMTVSSLPMGGSVMFLDVVSIYVDDTLLVDGKIDQLSLSSVGKMGGDFYITAKDLVELKRPQ